MRVRGDLVLVALRPEPEQTEAGLILAPALPPVMTAGRVLQVGPQVREVKPRDYVAFPPEAGAVEWQIGAHRCLFLRESAICAVMEAAPVQERA